MKTRNSDIIDFYRQLSLLLESNLPLPESLRQLAENFQRQDFKEVLSKLSDETATGTPLSDAMKNFPEQFQPFHIKMIEGGEKSGNLPEILREVAYISHIDSQLVSMVKSIAAYPIFVLLFSASLMLLIYTFIVPNFDNMFMEMLGGMPLPALTELTILISRFSVAYFPVLSIILGILIIFSFWLFLSGSTFAIKCFMKVIRHLPLSYPIFNNLMMARICSMWSVLMKQKMPADQAFQTIAGFMDDPAVSTALRNISRKVFEGKSLAESLEEEGVISKMISLTVKHSPERELPGELANLANVYKDRAATAIRNTGMTWEALLIIIMAVQVGAIVMSLFMPLIRIIDCLGGS